MVVLHCTRTHQRRSLLSCLIIPLGFTVFSLLISIKSTVFFPGRMPELRVDLDNHSNDTHRSDDTVENFSKELKSAEHPWTHIYYDLYGWRVMEPGAEEVSRSIAAGHEASELHGVVRRAISRLYAETGDPGYGPGDCVGGQLRFLPGRGVEYKMHFRDRSAMAAAKAAELVITSDPADMNSNSANIPALIFNPNSDLSVADYHTVYFQRQLGDLEVEYVGRTHNQLVHIILPYFHRPEALEAFLARFIQLVKARQPLALTVVRFSKGLPAMNESEELRDRNTARALVATAVQTLRGASVPPVRLLETVGPFSTGAGWLAAAAVTHRDDDIVMLAHVDLLFGERFLQRCRANAQPGKRAYYPVMFSTYNPDIAYGVFKKNVHQVREQYDNSHLLQTDLGYWADSDFSVSCQYLSDFRRFTEIFGDSIGHELDAMLYDRLVKSAVEVVRMPDPDLFQVYHKVTCLEEMGSYEYNTCLKTKAMNEASRLEWGLWVYKNLGDVVEVEWFMKMLEKNGIPLPAPKRYI